MKLNLNIKKSFRGAVPALMAASALWLTSCKTPQNITYFQDAEALNGMFLQAEQQLTLRPEDKINIVVSSSNPMLEQQFTLTASSLNNTLGATSIPETFAGRATGANTPLAYTVDAQGTINFPILGKISVAGKTRGQVAQYIQDRLIARELVDDPIVTVEYVNMGVNVLGEVGRPGHIDITKDHFTIVDAIAYAGDMTINGKRENVMVSRQVDGINAVYFIDMTNMQSMLQSPAYYLQQNDMVYVAPNKKKLHESRAVGNTFNTPAGWISVASLGATVITLGTTLKRNK